MRERRFTMADQRAFARLSGDFNPLHMDPLAARRLLFGRPVVHGIHSLLWALDCLTDTDPGISGIAEIDVSFNTPIEVGEAATLALTRAAPDRLEGTISAGGKTAVRIKIRCGSAPSSHLPVEDAAPKRTRCRLVERTDIEGRSGGVPLHCASDAAAMLLPRLAGWMPPWQIAIVLATTRVVGMECPGLHSIYNRLTLRFDPAAAGGDPYLRYRVTRWDPRFNMITMTVDAPGAAGTIGCFHRPAPAQQPPMAEVVRHVAANEFSGTRALVIGGSRGLGETTAKLIAAGGGAVTITYKAGRRDAMALVEDIKAFGGRAAAVPLDVCDPAAPLPTEESRFSHLFYFASPRIRSGKTGGFDADLFNDYAKYYVTGASSILKHLQPCVAPDVRVFYPSTIFLDERPAGFAEYIVAKAAGEALCRELARAYPQARFVVPRLPRLATDQTQSLVPVSTEDPLTVMLAALRDLSDGTASRSQSGMTTLR